MKQTFFLVALAATFLSATAGSAAEATNPNVVFLLADDFGWGDLACYGHPYARTPNLDRLASEGTRFEQFYATGVTCCPSRTGFMTSRWCASYREYPAGAGFGNRVTVTELLKKQGYRTGHFGKWHIGPEQSPGTYGIDSIGALDAEGKGGKRRDPRGRDAPIYDQAIAFIEQNKDVPFYVNVWGHITHFPVMPQQSYVDRFSDVNVNQSDFSSYMQGKFSAMKKAGGNIDDGMRRYLADVFSLDEDVGRLLKRIDELGLRENTIVVFSSDQGAYGNSGVDESDYRTKNKKRDGANNEKAQARLNMMGSAGPFRGGKHNMYEGGVRIPFIIRWPSHTPAGRVDRESVVSGIDWLPTLASLAGAKIDPADFEGEDISDAWLGKMHARSRPLMWKVSNPRSEIAIREGTWKLFYPGRKKADIELYNLATDPSERQNVATENPDIVRALTAKIERWNATLPTEYVKADDKND
jgi:N-acetylgalactosamine-6-sulfatase